jgi:hypothetical protein
MECGEGGIKTGQGMGLQAEYEGGRHSWGRGTPAAPWMVHFAGAYSAPPKPEA